jgi:3-hydroxyacyl-[acyl-carrier-protein] dehydratase
MRFEYFQLIDRIVELDLEKRTIRTQAIVPTASTIFEGHFPGFPLMPGVLLLESMAQASGWLIIGVTGFSRMPFLAAFTQAKLRAFVKPGDTLEVTAAISHEGSGFARTKAEIRHDGKLACNAEITFRVVEFPNAEFRRHMEKAAAALAFPTEHVGQSSDHGSNHG